MTLTEYCDAMNLQLRLNYYPNQSNRWSVNITDLEMKEDYSLRIVYGNGSSPDEALVDYVDKIKGQMIVIDAMDTNRREYVVPTTLMAK